MLPGGDAQLIGCTESVWVLVSGMPVRQAPGFVDATCTALRAQPALPRPRGPRRRTPSAATTGFCLITANFTSWGTALAAMDQLGELLKVAYGLSEAPVEWYLVADEAFIRLGADFTLTLACGPS